MTTMDRVTREAALLMVEIERVLKGTEYELYLATQALGVSDYLPEMIGADMQDKEDLAFTERHKDTWGNRRPTLKQRARSLNALRDLRNNFNDDDTMREARSLNALRDLRNNFNDDDTMREQSDPDA